MHAYGLLVTTMFTVGCAMAKPVATLEPLQLAAATEAPPPIHEDHFARDQGGAILPERLRELVTQPVFLEENARVGVVPVASGYEPGAELPMPSVPATLTSAIESAGLFELCTEVTTDWPTDRGVQGLRELAARYRVPYLLLYRQRFVDADYANAWAILDPTIIGALVTPNQTLETDGVLEATLFDVQSGTLLFTVYERVHDSTHATVWHDDQKLAELQQALAEQAAPKLADDVVAKVRRLAALRPHRTPDHATASLPAS